MEIKGRPFRSWISEEEPTANLPGLLTTAFKPSGESL